MFFRVSSIKHIAAVVLSLSMLSACGDKPDSRAKTETQEMHDKQQQMQASDVKNTASDTTAASGKQVERPLPELFNDIEKRTFQFFWDTTNEQNGMTPDRFPSRPFASIAAIGFALTAYPVGVEKGWINRTQAVDRTLTTLEFIKNAKMGPQATGTMGHKGFYYHFLDMQSGHRFEPWVELSSVDTALMMGGILFAQSYYDRDTPKEKAIRDVAEELYRKVEWPWMQKRYPVISMGWYPETGFIEHDWFGYNEAMLVYILALGSPTHPVEPDAWQAWSSTYDRGWGQYEGEVYLSFGPMFGHQYSHVWVDFRGIRDEYMRGKDMDYFDNSSRATYAQRMYAIENPMGWKDYGENVWGLTASDGPQRAIQEYKGEKREFRHYSARGAGLRDAYDDGTIAPTAALGSLVFAPDIVIPAAQEMHKRYGDYLYSSYGFLDAFNPSFTYDVPLKTGRLVPDKGWVASDYIAIDQGPILTMIANYRNDFVWKIMRKNPHIQRGLQRAGFTGGWLDELKKEQNAALADANKAAAGDGNAKQTAPAKAAAPASTNAETPVVETTSD